MSYSCYFLVVSPSGKSIINHLALTAVPFVLYSYVRKTSM